jgi:hypothetical protein
MTNEDVARISDNTTERPPSTNSHVETTKIIRGSGVIQAGPCVPQSSQNFRKKISSKQQHRAKVQVHLSDKDETMPLAAQQTMNQFKTIQNDVNTPFFPRATDKLETFRGDLSKRMIKSGSRNTFHSGS